MQIHRLIEILLILLDKEKVTSDELAMKLEVSKRTIYRDLECMAEANIPIVVSQGYNGGISMMEGYTLNKTFLTDEEKQQVMSALSAVGAVNKKSNTAVSKLASIFGVQNIDWIEVDFSNWYNVESIEERFEQIKGFIHSKSIIKISYISVKGAEGIREVAPLKLCFKSQAWYLYAFCYLKNDYRFFKLSRIRNLTTTGTHHQLKSQNNVLKTQSYFYDELIAIKLWIDKSKGGRVYDELSDVNIDENGDFVVGINCPNGVWLYNYILSFGDNVKIMEPESLRVEVKDYLKNVLKNFD